MAAPKSRLEYLRKINFFSQKEVADALGMSQQFYYKIESGKARLTIDVAQKLKNLYKLDRIDDLISEAS
ncbi:helix-turn-helix transcriptional regulator [Paenibacillus sp. HJGM_3]|uniref:helix-turn-helix transcriptional regulator n=1 Tax=Paenibacillus sp. HJGM_3 TaxID=3379816 RepID=UPI00385AE3E0